MGEKILALLKMPLVHIGLAVMLLIVLSGAGWGLYQTQIPPPQPIAFNHQLHIGLGVQCLYCHPGAWRGPSAGLPTQAKCWGCHQQIPITKEGQQ